MLTLWGRTSSSNVQKVAWLIAELELNVEQKDVGGPFGGLDTPEYIAMNPNCLIPTLQDEKITIWESEAILRYLGSKYGSMYFPDDFGKRAIIDQWMCRNQSQWFPAIYAAFIMIMKVPVAERKADELKRLVDNANQQALFIDNQLGKHRYLADDSMTLADFSFAAWLYRYFTLEIERPSLKNLEQYYKVLCAGPHYEQHVHVSYEFMRVPGAERP